MDYLGYAIWWNVGAAEVSHTEVGDLISDLGLSPPKPILPHDAFRRVTSEYVKDYELDDESAVRLDLHNAPSPQTMMVRHIVRTVTKAGVVQDVAKVGDCAFYRPPRGQNHRARMRVTVFPEALPDRVAVEEYAANLRREYDRALNTMDSQAVRRLVRSYLRSTGALYLGGAYVVREEQHAAAMEALFDRLPDSTCQVLPIPEDERSHRVLAAATPMAKEET